ncbi:hypothetical protein B0H19DRAFT_1277399 [Mycena capillaripes]|nr:hypothetical protein B0H19DRAFT_1277399 [Mycena capillaripes]
MTVSEPEGLALVEKCGSSTAPTPYSIAVSSPPPPRIRQRTLSRPPPALKQRAQLRRVRTTIHSHHVHPNPQVQVAAVSALPQVRPDDYAEEKDDESGSGACRSGQSGKTGAATDIGASAESSPAAIHMASTGGANGEGARSWGESVHRGPDMPGHGLGHRLVGLVAVDGLGLAFVGLYC